MENRIVIEDWERIYDRFADKEKLDGAVILITGCAGFLGFYFMGFFTHYSRSLRIKSIIGVDNFKLGNPAWVRELQKRYPGTFRLFNCDVADADMDAIKDAKKVDVIIHMASIASPVSYLHHPLETVDANVWGLRKLLDYYRNRKVRHFLFFSSSEIYGDPPAGYIPTREDYRGNVATIGPRACYDESKRFCETLCYIYVREFDMPIVVVRPFNNYGPGLRLDDGRVHADFARAVFDNTDITIYSDGTPRRTFCYVSDALSGYLEAMVYRGFECFNIGADKPEISVQELAQIYVEMGGDIAGYTGRVRFKKSGQKEYLINCPSRRCPDIAKARRLLNFKPRTGIREGVARYLEFIKIRGGRF